MAATSVRLLRLDAVLHVTGLKPTPLYEQTRSGLFPRAVKIGARAVAWPAHEVEAVIAARIAGKSDDALRTLVAELELQRTRVAGAA